MPDASHDNGSPHRCHERSTKRLDTLGAASLCRSGVDEEHLISIVIDQVGEPHYQSCSLRRRQLATKHGILDMVAAPAHVLIHTPQALVVRDVVADEYDVAHD